MITKEKKHQIRVLINSLNSTKSKIETTISTLEKELKEVTKEPLESKPQKSPDKKEQA